MDGRDSAKGDHVPLIERVCYGAAGCAIAAAAVVYGFRKEGFFASLPERCTLDSFDRRSGERLLWFHAASMGEVRGVVPLVKLATSTWNPDEVLVTCTTTTGKEEVRRHLPDVAVKLLALDHPWAMRRDFERIRPSAIVITETEVWPNLLIEARMHQVPVCIVNARISDRSFPRYKRLQRFFAPLLRHIAFIGAQSTLDRERFITLGAIADRVVVTGSSKYDNEPKRWDSVQKESFLRDAGLTQRNRILVAGSVRGEEDQAIIRGFVTIRAQFSQTGLIIAPRHPDRFEVVYNELIRAGLDVHRWSEGPASRQVDVLLLDTVGELSAVYGVGTIAYVGGSMVPIGGHNPLEPAAHQVPVTMGPYVANVRDVATELESRGGLRTVSNAEQFSAVCCSWLANDDERKRAGEVAFEVWQGHKGATARTIAAVGQAVPEVFAPGTAAG